MPAPFALGAAYPNPFNPQTQITYELPGQTHVTLTMYNLLGQEIIRLVDQVQPAGPYAVTWNGRNTQGVSVASGVYMYRLTTDSGFQTTRRVTLLK
jgi:flagellar hook assembly protein FlgD